MASGSEILTIFKRKTVVRVFFHKNVTISPFDYLILFVIGEKEFRFRDINHALVSDKVNTSKAIRKMVNSGLINQDSVSLRYSLSLAGKQMLRHCEERLKLLKV